MPKFNSSWVPLIGDTQVSFLGVNIIPKTLNTHYPNRIFADIDALYIRLCPLLNGTMKQEDAFSSQSAFAIGAPSAI